MLKLLDGMLALIGLQRMKSQARAGVNCGRCEEIKAALTNAIADAAVAQMAAAEKMIAAGRSVNVAIRVDAQASTVEPVCLA